MTPVAAAKKQKRFDPQTFLSTINGGRKMVTFPKKKMIFAQDDPSDAVFYIQTGKVKLTILSKARGPATGIFGECDFFGEGCLSGQAVRTCSATAVTDCTVMCIDIISG